MHEDAHQFLEGMKRFIEEYESVVDELAALKERVKCLCGHRCHQVTLMGSTPLTDGKCKARVWSSGDCDACDHDTCLCAPCIVEREVELKRSGAKKK